jgi:hypothetical protein
MKRILSIFALVLFSLNAICQESATKSDTLRKDALNLFVNPNDFGGDTFDYIKKEIPYVNYVRDIKDAGLYILASNQGTGSGGREYTYFLIGQNKNAGMRDTISFVTSPDETQDEIRIKMVMTLKMGLMRYVAKTPLSKYMTIGFSEPLSETVTTDKWDSWVFRTSMNGFLNGEQLTKQTQLFGDFSANRITKNWKINSGIDYSYGRDVFDTTGGFITSDNISKSANVLIVKSLTDHWSYGGSGSVGSSSYNNHRMLISVMPGIEYDIFPYSESTRRQLRLLYRVGLHYVSYIDSTIYDKTKETLWLQSFTAAYQVVQKWGSINLSFGYSNYLHDWSKNNISLDGFVEVRIAKGLTANFGGGASIIHDQLGLVKGGASTQEVLLRRKQLATQYQYFTVFGFTFTFGSIYNNVVNPRFGNSNGGGMTITMN